MRRCIPTCGAKSMNRCKECNVQVYESERRCPLCHADMGQTKPTEVVYPEYSDIITLRSPLRNLPLFVSLTSIIVCVLVNWYTYDASEILWAGIVTAGVLYGFAMYKLTRTRKKNHGAKMLYSYITTGLLLLAINLFVGGFLWSVDIVLPALSLATIVYLTVCALRNRERFSEYFGYIMAVTLIGIAALVVWGIFIGVAVGVVIVLGLYLFADKGLREEIRKRFHR